ncbi:T3SS effector HopA1 family protein [Chroococcus sp. FPU101]|uniref:T3SS effector HopA1 family protein n=1 Tax=Chroococcus sp. FPU101 TaxID=1974212 RepID=UPI001A90A577|nr:T3SS effector HopA1 family protein [Chroococcus sp. FPU101]GFE68857.1 hypothetical protein CFPU101_14670 [Chroococcus sp. FPU101]
MQLLNIDSKISPHLVETLQDIASQVEIQSNFCIRHPKYQTLELPEKAVTYFQRIPVELKHKYLNLQLQSFLYGVYYNGSMRSTLTPKSNTENNTLLGIDLEFYDHLHQSNHGQGYFDSGWLVVQEESDGTLAVTKKGLTLHIERAYHLINPQSAVGDLVAIRMPKNLMQNGFYVAVGNAGTDERNQPQANSVTVRIYFHLIAEGAVAVMDSLTQHLNDLKIPFSFKVLYSPDEYQRYDSGVLYFERSYYPTVRQVLQTVYLENQIYFREQIPLFTKPLALGLALAEEPDYKFTKQESFGMNRCQMIANGLLQSWYKRESSPEHRLASILEQFSSLGIKLECPFLNADSEDIYLPLSVL